MSLFGWTLGGVYLARYSDSPVGAFDELVVLAGLVWNAPTSCAWAQRVYVNSHAARDHGIKSVGLPSRLAAFAQSDAARPGVAADGSGGGVTGAARDTAPEDAAHAWWNEPYAPHRETRADAPVLIANCENGRRGHSGAIAQLQLPRKPRGPGLPLRMHLPNFSGGTPEHPGLAYYKCDLRARLKPLLGQVIRAGGEYDRSHAEDVSSVLQGRPVLCIEFADMHMSVPHPTPLQWSGDKLKYVKA